MGAHLTLLVRSLPLLLCRPCVRASVCYALLELVQLPTAATWQPFGTCALDMPCLCFKSSRNGGKHPPCGQPTSQSTPYHVALLLYQGRRGGRELESVPEISFADCCCVFMTGLHRPWLLQPPATATVQYMSCQACCRHPPTTPLQTAERCRDA